MSAGADTSRPDGAIDRVRDAVLALDSDGMRTAQVLRETYDQIYNGQYTGRYRFDQLHKTEKTHLGTIVEINLHREFEFEDGVDLDYRIAGEDVDCKWSMAFGGWMIPPEAQGKVCMLVWGDDQASRWSLGLVRADPKILNLGANRDQKATIRADAREARIRWVWRDAELPPNVLLQLPQEEVERILGHRHGTQKVNDLFRVAQGRRISRAVVATVAQQLDPMKRVRANGGARSVLRPEGIVILSGEYHTEVARRLGLPVPLKSEFISARVVPAESGYTGPAADLQGRRWRLANDDDPVVEAPLVTDN